KLTSSPRFGSLPKVLWLRDEEEEEVKRTPILYEDLRNKNRENYDITRNQKIVRDTPKKD
ncbi:ocia domain-containing protein 1, partial [Clarias magur]